MPPLVAITKTYGPILGGSQPDSLDGIKLIEDVGTQTAHEGHVPILRGV